MRYGYNLKDKKELEMYLQKKQGDYKRVFNNNMSIQEKYIDYLNQQKKENNYFIERERQEKELEQMKNDFIKQVEDETENAIDEILKSFNFN